VELLQPLVGRDCSWVDLRNGLLGVILGTCFPLPFGTRFRVALFAAIAVSSSIFVTLPAWTALRSELWQRNHFPLLADFENPLQLGSWQSETSADEAPARFALAPASALDGSNSLRISFAAGSWGSVCFSASDRDWSAYRALEFEIRAAVIPFALHLRIDDDGDVEQFDSRFNIVSPLRPDWMRSEIPIEQIAEGSGGRRLNLHAIRRICFFAGAEQNQQQAYLDNLKLVN
jgi:hypothetical protein